MRDYNANRDLLFNVWACVTVIALAAMTLYCAFLFGEQHQAKKMDNLYPISTRVVELDYTTDTVTVEQANGMLWSFYGCDDWELGDNCNLIMDDNGTPEVYDDIIVDYRYSM